MLAKRRTPILNVSDTEQSFAWFERLGWTAMTFGEDGDEEADKGAWMSIWVDDVEAVHRRGLEQDLEVMHVRHPDGHVFRISRGIEDEGQT
jgi:hypothetical protein